MLKTVGKLFGLAFVFAVLFTAASATAKADTIYDGCSAMGYTVVYDDGDYGLCVWSDDPWAYVDEGYVYYAYPDYVVSVNIEYGAVCWENQIIDYNFAYEEETDSLYQYNTALLSLEVDGDSCCEDLAGASPPRHDPGSSTISSSHASTNERIGEAIRDHINSRLSVGTSSNPFSL